MQINSHTLKCTEWKRSVQIMLLSAAVLLQAPKGQTSYEYSTTDVMTSSPAGLCSPWCGLLSPLSKRDWMDSCICQSVVNYPLKVRLVRMLVHFGISGLSTIISNRKPTCHSCIHTSKCAAGSWLTAQRRDS